ncbi:unnamed protein product [Discula destructiva]
MRSQIILSLLVAVASSRPTLPIDARELQYSDIKDIYAAREGWHAGVGPREVQYSDIVALLEEDARLNPRHGHPSTNTHGENGRARHHPQPLREEHDGDHGYHHHQGPHDSILENIIGFLAHQARRSFPDAADRVVEGISSFLAGQTRDVHEHQPHHEPRNPDSAEHDVGKHILDFFASAAK